jgi:hypothetical protein
LPGRLLPYSKLFTDLSQEGSFIVADFPNWCAQENESRFHNVAAAFPMCAINSVLRALVVEPRGTLLSFLLILSGLA